MFGTGSTQFDAGQGFDDRHHHGGKLFVANRMIGDVWTSEVRAAQTGDVATPKRASGRRASVPPTCVVAKQAHAKLGRLTIIAERRRSG